MNDSSRTTAGGLLTDRRFGPLFLAQFFGAFNDNVFKNALVLLVAFRGISVFGLRADQVVALASGIFILPFFLFSAFSGQLADKYSKATLIRWVKLGEVGVMVLGGVSLFIDSAPLSLGVLFLLGTQAALFGPLKYGVLPELLSKNELVLGNALVELGTFLAILLGTILGGVLIGLGQSGVHYVAGIVVVVSIVGWIATFRLPPGSPAEPTLELEPRIFRPTWRLLRMAQKQPSVWHSILGISWFWLLGSVVLSVLPSLVKDNLHGSEAIVTYFLALFSIGVGVGALLAEKLSFSQLELGLVPLGSLGITAFLVDVGLLLMFGEAPAPGAAGVLTLGALLETPFGIHLSLALLAFSIASGLFTVPLYTLLQERSDEKTRARVIAANNVQNAVFMVAGALILIGFFALGITIPQVLVICAAMNLAVAVYIYSIIPEFMLRFFCYCLSHVLYRVQVSGRANVPQTGAAVLVCNHITFVDWLVLASATQRPIRFVMDNAYANLPGFRKILKDAKVIPIASAKQNPKVLEAAFDEISRTLGEGELVCIFPEGRLTSDGAMSQFKRGIERIVERDAVPVIPMHLDGLWGSYFSRAPSRRLLGKLWSSLALKIGEPVLPQDATAALLEERVRKLGPAREANAPFVESSAA
jgi:1-acyl-sn-glycerol-3-phosphate acyltransferase